MKSKRKKNEEGFTLIELIMVIVILGIISAVAIPRFLSLGDSARTSAARGVASAVNASIQSEHAALLIAGTAYNLNDVLTGTSFSGGVTHTAGVGAPVPGEIRETVLNTNFALNLAGNTFTWLYTDVTTDDVPALTSEVAGGGGF